MARSVALAGALAAWAAPAAAQQATGAPPATILVIAIERVLEESVAAQNIRGQIEAARSVLRDEAAGTDQALKAEEEELVALKQTLDEDAFEVRVRAFEDRVREARRGAQEKGAALQAAIAAARSDLRRRLTPVLVAIMRDKGATVLLDETQVVLSARELDVTDEAIARLNVVAPSLALDYPPSSTVAP